MSTILAVFAHPDDELGCIGTLISHSQNGDNVHLLFLTKGENSSVLGGTDEERIIKRRKHTQQIEELAGVQVHFLDFPDSRIQVSVEGAYLLAEKIKEVRPNCIITWNQPLRPGAGHPDHRACSQLVFDAINYARYRSKSSKFKPFREPITLYQYYDPQVDYGAQIQYIDVTDYYDKIMRFVEIYQEAYGDWPVKTFKTTWLQTNGRECNVPYAEAFKIVVRGYGASKLLPLDIPPRSLPSEKENKTTNEVEQS